MKFGAVLPHYEMPPTVENVRKFILAVEAMGYDYLLAYDHVLGANPDREGGWDRYDYRESFHEVLTLFGYAAAITTTLELATGILILPQRQTALVAKQAAQVDVLSNGRLRLGVGIGWNHLEYESLGENFKNRGYRTAEQVEVLQLLWEHELVNFSGEFHTLDDVGINPLPIQRPIPVWFGGGADAVLKRMAKYGAGWMPGEMPLEEVKARLGKLHAYLQQEGRDPADFGIDTFMHPERYKPNEIAAYIETWQNVGATHMSAISMGAGHSTVEQHLSVLERFISTVK